MPANLTPEYFKAERWFREATTTEEKILALEQMLSVMPKHKGTDHLRADLRKKLSKLKEAPAKKGKAKHVDIFYIPRSGSGQIVLLGTPNCGKSSIVAALTNAKVNVADFPFATTAPVPGMVTFEDVQIQLVDMPPITADYSAPGQVGTYRNCDLIGICIDLSADVKKQLRICLDFLESRNLLVDTETSTGVEKLRGTFFKLLNIIRIYAKPPGKPADMNDPFTLPAGSTVMDLASAIHRELAEKLKFARIWGTGVYDGQNAQRNHVLNDKDIIELHFW